MAQYSENLKRSFTDLREKPVLLVPFILQPLVVVVLAIALVLLGLLAVFPAMGIGLADFESEEAVVAAFAGVSWTPALIATIAGAALLILLVIIAVSSWFVGGSLTMIDDVVEGRPTGAASFFAGARDRFASVLGFTLISSLIYILAAAPAALFIILAITNEGGRIASIILAIVFVLFFIAAALFITAGLIFGQPILIREKAGAAETVRRSFALLRDETGPVILTGLIVLGIGFAVGLAFGILTLPIALLADAQPENVGIQVANGVASLIQNLVSVIVGIALALFLFRMHKEIVAPAAGATKPAKKTARTAKK